MAIGNRCEIAGGRRGVVMYTCLQPSLLMSSALTLPDAGTWVPFLRCPSDGGLESSLTSPWARMTAASKALATSHAIPLMAVSSALKTSKSETFRKKTFLLMKSEASHNLVSKLHDVDNGRMC